MASLSPSPSPLPTSINPQPGPLNFIAGFLLVGLAWGLTTPFIRRAARTHSPRPHVTLSRPIVKNSVILRNALGGLFAVVDLLRNPRYAIPLLLNLSGSIWFFLLVGKAELSLTIPIVNTLAFLFTVLGDWLVEGKVISGQAALGMLLCLAGIALCVHSKS